jgi:hypothetical protein
MANTGARLKPEAIREVAFGAITANYVQMGGNLLGPTRLIYIANTTDQDCYISFDGVTNQYRILSNTFRLIDCKTNDGFFDAGQAIYLKYVSTPPESGLVFVEATYS